MQDAHNDVMASASGTAGPLFTCPLRIGRTVWRPGHAEQQHGCVRGAAAQECLVRAQRGAAYCSLRLYEKDSQSGIVSAVSGPNVGFCTTCPERFYENDIIFGWIGQTVLGHTTPAVLSEIGFLERWGTASEDETPPSDVGKIDHVLVHPDRDPLAWCALEMQAVYFSEASMGKEFSILRGSTDSGIPFPVAHRRPDFRSSGPKRLMPQLQIKVPALRRWGKKVAVVVDRAFFDALGQMDDAADLSNADIAWFVVEYAEFEHRVALQPAFVRLTTLERAVEGLTAGRPVSLETFEQRIREKLSS